MSTIRFVLRKDRPLRDGAFPVDLVYQLRGQKKYFRTEIALPEISWDEKNYIAKYYNRTEVEKFNKERKSALNFYALPRQYEIDEYNALIGDYKQEIGKIEKLYILNNVPFSVETIVDELKRRIRGVVKKEPPKNVVFEFIQQYIDDHKDTREAASLKIYKSLKNHLQNYCKHTGKKVTFEHIDYAFFQSFQKYLLQDKKDEKGKVIPGLNNTSVAKHLSTVKTFLNYARKQGVEVSNKYKDFTIKREPMGVIALTNDEFERLYNLDLSNNKRLDETRNVFCFACATGLRYSDLNLLRREHIKDDEIKITVKKTKDILSIPLNNYSLAILEKYKHCLKPLPVISNQNLNYAIKDLCKHAELNEETEIVRFKGTKREATIYPKYELIGVHTARKTFVTLSLERGMSAEEVMSITGHKDYKSFKRYVKITEQRKKVVMLKAWGGSVDHNKLKAV